MSVQSLLDGLDAEQKNAVTLGLNGVVTAGAGSGKTKVLASRYVWLVTEKGFSPDEILALTFTNKAVSEMYSRIYSYLLDESVAGSEKAALALAEFHKARVSTLDSFSAGVARMAAARYGVSPDFQSDDTALRKLAAERALQFVLDNREAFAIRQLLPDHKIRELAKDFFAKVILEFSPISDPPNYDRFLEIQKNFVLAAWREKTALLDQSAVHIRDAVDALEQSGRKRTNFTTALVEVFATDNIPAPPDIAPLFEADSPRAEETDPAKTKIRRQLKTYFAFYSKLASVSLQGMGRPAADLIEIVEDFRFIKGSQDNDGLFQIAESIANYSLNFDLCRAAFRLLEKFQNEFNAVKRETGLLSFNDISHLAKDALRDHPDIRKAYRDSVRMIMIDEFQDNNALQRDLIYLLAEKSGRQEKTIPLPGDLEPDRMFFVGDEKQSIYRFRGADVAVFRSLGRTIGSRAPDGLPGQNINLIHNYRSRPGLVAAFNRVFSGVFLPDGVDGDSRPDSAAGIPDYEAAFSPVLLPDGAGGGPLVSFCFLNGGDLPEDDTSGIKPQDLEAVFIAEKIRGMVMNGEKIPKRKDGSVVMEPCGWGDFAVLQRSYTHQASLEKYFREFGVPYNTDRPSGLFNDAPILDLRAYLRLLVYPGDRVAYASLLRSPFARLSDVSLSVCMLNAGAEPFSPENESLIPEDELELYCRAGQRYRALREACGTLTITELITRLWFDEGYRYETLWTESAQVYESLFDFFFSLASDAEARGMNIAEFIEYLDDVMNGEEKPDDKDIPGESGAGVRIMSIHKAKGLEFPVVFIFGCANAANRITHRGLVNFHENFGPVLKIPAADEVSAAGNYIQKIIDDEETAKSIAELRRLLYVAMTRAESRLFLTFSLDSQNADEKKKLKIEGGDFSAETILLRLAQLEQKAAQKTRDNFLKLLLPVLSSGASGLWNFETIPVLSRDEISARAAGGKKNAAKQAGKKYLPVAELQREAALAAALRYDKADLITEGKAGPERLDASRFRYSGAGTSGGQAADNSDESGRLDALLEKAKFSAREFGSLVHAVLEAKLNGEESVVPRKFLSRTDNEKALAALHSSAIEMADSFLDSDLGKRWKASTNREAEFPVITSVTAEEKPIAVMGQIDLVFEEGNEVVVVDFKTDRAENPPDHFGQLAVYCRAAADIFGKPTAVWLYYLRSGNAVNVTGDVKNLALEKMAAAAFAES